MSAGSDGGEITLMLGGDVMLGRGLDQILPHPGSPALYEEALRSALDYVALAERRNGPVARPVPFSYPWGDALRLLEREAPDLRIVNLETAVTRRGRPEPKGINYRMSPANLPCLTAARIDCCGLANNHVLDWGGEGLVETLDLLGGAGIATAGAGRDLAAAAAPAVLVVAGKGRVLVYAAACGSSGVPAGWAAGPRRPGVWRIGEPSEAAACALSERIAPARRPGDLVVLSLHWGGNWGYEIPPEQRRFARRLLAEGAVDVVHGHSSHHFKGIELFRGKPILYGCGDLLNDYEGIGSHAGYRSDLVLLYLLRLSPADGRLRSLEAVPFRLGRLRLNRAEPAEARWVLERMSELCRELSVAATGGPDGAVLLAAANGG